MATGPRERHLSRGFFYHNCEVSMAVTFQGTISAVKQDGYGFIRCQSRSVFFHRSALAPGLPFDASLLERAVEFDEVSSERGPRAMNVRALS